MNFDFDNEKCQKGYDKSFLKWKKEMDCSEDVEEYKLFDNAGEWQVEYMYKSFMDGRKSYKKEMMDKL